MIASPETPSPTLPHGDRLSDFSRDRRILPLTALAAIIGAFSTVTAWLLLDLINLVTNIAFHGRFSFEASGSFGHAFGPWIIVVPAAGGLLIGLMARYGSEKIRGHGIPEALEAILIGRSRMSLKVALLKPISSALSIGTGGPFGAEGPIIMTGGAAGSLIAQLFRLSAAERKTLLVAGAAGGMAAVFGTPVAATLLAVELLLFEWRPRSFIPVAIAAIVAAVLRGPILGQAPIFPVALHGHLGAETIALALVMGLISGLGSGALTALVYAFEDLFAKVPFHWMWWPALGGLAVGLGGWIDPRALGVGYDSIHGLLLGGDLGGGILKLFLVKGLIWAIALGSGTSGGVLAPLLILGGTLGYSCAHLFPGSDTALWAMVGMTSMMGGTMRAPLTAAFFGLELTHDISVLPALLAGCVAAHTVTVLLLRRSILTEKLSRRGLHLSREYAVDPLQTMRVGDMMDLQVNAVPPDLKVAELYAKVSGGDPDFIRHRAHAIVDSDGTLIGIITSGDVSRALVSPDGGTSAVLDAGTSHPITAFPDETLEEAAGRMVRLGVGRLLVVHRETPGNVIGYLGRSELLRARLQRMDEEGKREGPWSVRFGIPRAESIFSRPPWILRPPKGR